jgi:hypothetical protein
MDEQKRNVIENRIMKLKDKLRAMSTKHWEESAKIIQANHSNEHEDYLIQNLNEHSENDDSIIRQRIYKLEEKLRIIDIFS